MWKLLKDSLARREVYEKVDVYFFLTANKMVWKWANCWTGSWNLTQLPKVCWTFWSPYVSQSSRRTARVLMVLSVLFFTPYYVQNSSLLKCSRGLEDLLWWLMQKFVLKETLAKADSGRKLLKMNPQDINNQKPTDHIKVRSAAKLHIAEYRKKTSCKESKLSTFRKDVLLATLYGEVSYKKCSCKVCDLFWS